MEPVASSMRAVTWENPLLNLKKSPAAQDGMTPQEAESGTLTMLAADAGDTVAISAAGLRASVESLDKHDTSLPDSVPTIDSEKAGKTTFSGTLQTGKNPESGGDKEYGGIPFVHSDLGSYTGGTSDVSTGNIDNRSEQLKAMMNGMQAMQNLQLDQSKAMMNPAGSAIMGSGVQEDVAGDMGKSENSQTMGNAGQPAAPGMTEKTDETDPDDEERATEEYGGMPYVKSELGSYGGGISEVRTDTGVGQTDSVYIKAILEAKKVEREAALDEQRNVMDAATEAMKKEEAAAEENENTPTTGEYGGMPHVQSNLGSYGGGTATIRTDAGRGSEVPGAVQALRVERRLDMEKGREVMDTATEETEKEQEAVEKEEQQAERQGTASSTPAQEGGVQNVADDPLTRANAQQQQIRFAYQRLETS